MDEYVRQRRQRRVRYPGKSYLTLYSITGETEHKREHLNKQKENMTERDKTWTI